MNTIIKEARQKQGISIAEMGRRLGVSRPQASRLEGGSSGITGEMAVKLEKVLGVPRCLLRPDLFVIGMVPGEEKSEVTNG